MGPIKQPGLAQALLGSLESVGLPVLRGWSCQGRSAFLAAPSWGGHCWQSQGPVHKAGGEPLSGSSRK